MGSIKSEKEGQQGRAVCLSAFKPRQSYVTASFVLNNIFKQSIKYLSHTTASDRGSPQDSTLPFFTLCTIKVRIDMKVFDSDTASARQVIPRANSEIGQLRSY